MSADLILSNWMNYIDDKVRLVDLVMPGTHNSGSYGMNFTACCQDDDMYVQALYGARHFCIRLDTLSDGQIVLCHGPTKGQPFENALRDLARILEEMPTEFFIFDIREYYPQVLLGKHLTFSANAQIVDELLEKYLHVSENAMYGFGHISKLTMGDIRAAGKKFLLLNYRGDYHYSENYEHIFPWKKNIYGGALRKYLRDSVKLYDEFHTQGLYWFQIQRTPSIGALMGLVTPRVLEKYLVPKFDAFIASIENNPNYLKQANILCGDFMTWDQHKCKRIIAVNLKKDNVIEDKRVELEELLK